MQVCACAFMRTSVRPCACVQDVLRGRLEVVRALVCALDRASEGSNTHQDLVRLLLNS